MTKDSTREWKKARVYYDADSVRRPQSPATDKQIDFYMSLGRTREIGMSVEEFEAMAGALKDAGALTKGFVSERLTEYKGAELRATKHAEPGYYVHEGDFHVVVRTKDKKRVYAKTLTKVGSSETGKTKFAWEYNPGMGAKVAFMTPLTLEEAAKFGHLHGQCLICLRQLTDPESVKAGIGPVCASKLKGKK
jgi:hypothetical protein